jgi:aminoglycoside N3'-acetyltransferase
MVTRSHIITALSELGLAAGDCVLVHSSLSSMGNVESGADTVIDAFLSVLGSEGTLVMPTLCQKEMDRRFEIWDVRTSPSDVGRITETFRLRPGVLRSDHATHSVAATGRWAFEITQGHRTASGRPGPWGDAAFGRGSPWEKLYDLEAQIVFLGVDFRVNTMGHFVEHRIAERAIECATPDRQPVMREGLRGWQKTGVWPNLDRMKLQGELEPLSLLSRARCGEAMLLTVPAKAMVDAAISMAEADPCAWLNGEFCAWLEEEER